MLGYLNPRGFAGGEITLDYDAPAHAVEKVAKPLSLSPLDAAYGVHRVVNARMADQIRLVSVRRGYDPRHFALVLLGGAGPVHGGILAAELAIPTVIVPETPGILSALGLLVANIEHEQAMTLGLHGRDVTVEVLARAFELLERQCWRWMQGDHVTPEQVTILRSAEVRYVGQSYEL
jgi:N-methylhydantoinase A